MRKFYLFTLALLSAVGAWAQVSFDNTKWYLITEVSTGKYVASRTSATGAEGSFGMMAAGTKGDLFRITARGESGFVLTNAEGKTLGNSSDWNTTERETVWTIEESDGSYTLKALRQKENETEKKYLNYQPKNPNSIYVDGTGEDVDHKIHFQIEEATDYATVKYTYTLNGTDKATVEQIVVANGAMYPTPKGLPKYVSAPRPEGVVNTADAVDGILTESVSCTQSLPFEAFNSVSGISKWYYVKMHSNNTRYIRDAVDYISYPYTGDGSEDDEIFQSEVNHESALWGFVGDAFGMKLVSKSGKVVKSTGNGAASFTTNEAEGTEFVLIASSANNAWFCMKYPGSTQYLNANNNQKKVVHWNQTDAGSSMQAEEVKTDVVVNGLVDKLAKLTPFDIPEGSTVQGPSEFANPTEINEAISDFTTESVASGTLLKKRAFLHSSNGQKLINYVNQVATYGSLANIQFEMKAQYGTLIMPCPSSAVAGLKTYRCSGVDANNVVTLAPNGTNGGGALAQEVPYIIEATPGAKFTIIGWDKGSRETHTDDNGYLTGVLADEGANIPVNSYVLAKNKEGKVGFFKVTGNEVKCPQYKCYLTVPASAPGSTARAFYFSSDDVETGINAVEIEEATPANAVIYDLSGRRVQGAKSGLYIVNGKKVIK